MLARPPFGATSCHHTQAGTVMVVLVASTSPMLSCDTPEPRSSTRMLSPIFSGNLDVMLLRMALHELQHAWTHFQAGTSSVTGFCGCTHFTPFTFFPPDSRQPVCG